MILVVYNRDFLSHLLQFACLDLWRIQAEAQRHGQEAKQRKSVVDGQAPQAISCEWEANINGMKGEPGAHWSLYYVWT